QQSTGQLTRSSNRPSPDQFLRSKEPRQQAPKSMFQAPKKHQAPNSKSDLRSVCPGVCFWGLVFEISNVSGAWGLVLVLGVSLSDGSKAETGPPSPLRSTRPCRHAQAPIGYGAWLCL